MVKKCTSKSKQNSSLASKQLACLLNSSPVLALYLHDIVKLKSEKGQEVELVMR